jgi:hypothetical protein
VYMTSMAVSEIIDVVSNWDSSTKSVISTITWGRFLTEWVSP